MREGGREGGSVGVSKGVTGRAESFNVGVSESTAYGVRDKQEERDITCIRFS